MAERSTVMLASNAGELRFPYLASPKMDGIRAYVRNGVVYSRRDIALPNTMVQQMFGDKKLDDCDGELIVGDPVAPDVFQVTQSFVMSKSSKIALPLRFFVFDKIPTMGIDGLRPFRERLIKADMACRAWGGGKMLAARIVRHVYVRNAGQLQTYENAMIAHGYEGVMLRDPDGFYKQGRSTAREHGLLKLKRVADAEAVVLGVIELQHNLNEKDSRGRRTSHKDGKIAGGKLGALRVRDKKNGAEFEIGTGFTEQERQDLWKNRTKLPGKLVRYRYQEVGTVDKPRFPRFAGFRDKRDA